MKIIRLHIVIILSSYFVSCVPVQKENKESVNKIQKNKNLADSIVQKIEFLEKDTLFSKFTNDMNYTQFLSTFEELSKENPSFYIDQRKISSSAFDSNPYEIKYTKQPCYIFYVNGKEYLFDVDFNFNYFNREMMEYRDTTLDFLVLHFEEKGKSIINEILNIYKSKYGLFKRESKTERSYGSVYKPSEDKSENELSSITVEETYTWNSKPTIQIKYIKVDQIRSYWSGNLIPRIKKNTIDIIYFSKEFYSKWQKIEKERDLHEQELLIKKKLSNRTDI